MNWINRVKILIAIPPISLYTFQLFSSHMGGFIGHFAAINCKPRQARKGAAAAVMSGAGARLMWTISMPEDD